MKTWNTPEISELNINETASGCHAWDFELWLISHEEEKATPDPANDPS